MTRPTPRPRLPDARQLYRDLAQSSPALAAGRVRCERCGRVERVDSAECLRRGWPRCHGETMRLWAVGR